MSLFPERPERPRIAAFLDYEFPVERDRETYERLDAWAGSLDAECRVVHTVVADPAAQPIALRARCGEGLFVPQDSGIHLNDVEHVRDTLGDRFDALLTTLQDVAQASLAALMVQPQMQEAFSMTRWLRAWQPDLIVSLGIGQGAMQAMIASFVLDVPRVAVIDTLKDDSLFATLLPLHAQQAELLLAGDATTHDQLAAHLAGRPDKALRANDPAALPRVAALLRRERSHDQPTLGPDAAFRTRPSEARELPAKPFVVLGTERTGSNMLVDMLSTRPGVCCAGELFNPRRIRERVIDWPRGLRDDRDELLALRRRSPRELHQRLCASAARDGAHHVGCKLLYYHGLIDDRVTDFLAARDDLPFVHLTRRQRLRQSLSMARAKQSDEWFAQHGTRRPSTQAFELDTRAVATDFTMGELFEQRYRALLRRHRVLELDYGELANRLPAATAQIGELLGADLGELRPRSVKTGGGDLAAAVANYDDVRAAFAGTRWQPLTDERSGDE